MGVWVGGRRGVEEGTERAKFFNPSVTPPLADSKVVRKKELKHCSNLALGNLTVSGGLVSTP